MAIRIDSAKRILNGTFGEVWADGEKVAEVIAFQSKVSKKKETINLCGQFMDDSKATNASGAGSITMYKVDSGFAQRQGDLQNGVDRRFTVISKLKDPDAGGPLQRELRRPDPGGLAGGHGGQGHRPLHLQPL